MGIEGKNKVVTNEYVEKAINEKVYRNNRIEERMREMIAEGTLIVDTSGEKAGQVNGLASLIRGLQLRQTVKNNCCDIYREGRSCEYRKRNKDERQDT